MAATVAATDGEAVPRIEIVAERRRAHDAVRAMVVSESMAAGARVQDVAARHGICRSLYRWRRIAGAAGGSAVHLFPVRIATAPNEPLSEPVTSPLKAGAPRRSGVIEIELSSGVRVSVDESVSVTALRRVMSVLRG